MDNQIVSYIAIDIAKDTLCVRTEDDKIFEVANSDAGIKRLLSLTARIDNRHFVCEASGGYERRLVNTLHGKGETVSLVSAPRVRYFAGSEGTRAKTDPIDTGVILRFAKEKKPRPTPPPSTQRQTLCALLDRREQLTEQAKREKTRLQNSEECLHALHREMIEFVNKQIKLLDKKIMSLIDADASWARAAQILMQIKGLGPVNTWSILAYLPEITSLNRNQIVALVGVAPFNYDTGTSTAPRKIMGGRSKLRRCLYLAATSAARHNPVIKPYVARLRARGKPYKSAIVAAIRKMLIHAHSQLKKNEILLAQ